MKETHYFCDLLSRRVLAFGFAFPERFGPVTSSIEIRLNRDVIGIRSADFPLSVDVKSIFGERFICCRLNG